MLELQLRVGAGTKVGALLQYHRRPTGVSVEQQQGLIVAFDTSRHYVLPLWADLGVQHGDNDTNKQTCIKIDINTLGHIEEGNLSVFGYNIVHIPLNIEGQT